MPRSVLAFTYALPSGDGLMAAHYHPTQQQCVDKAAVQAVAAKRNFPLGQLNWCKI